jgi:hypothetical protein
MEGLRLRLQGLFFRKLKHTVNKVSSLRDFCRTMSYMSSLTGFLPVSDCFLPILHSFRDFLRCCYMKGTIQTYFSRLKPQSLLREPKSLLLLTKLLLKAIKWQFGEP